jgi:hypothetical protein
MFVTNLLGLLDDLDELSADGNAGELLESRMALSARLHLLATQLAKSIAYISPGSNAVSVNIVDGFLLGERWGMLNICPSMELAGADSMKEGAVRLLSYAVPFSLQVVLMYSLDKSSTCEIRLIGNSHPDAKILARCICEHADTIALALIGSKLHPQVKVGNKSADLRKFVWARDIVDFEVALSVNASKEKLAVHAYLDVLIEVISVAAGDLFFAC